MLVLTKCLSFPMSKIRISPSLPHRRVTEENLVGTGLDLALLLPVLYAFNSNKRNQFIGKLYVHTIPNLTKRMKQKYLVSVRTN